MKQLMILKFGGSIITDKKSSEPKIDSDNLERIAKEVSSGYDKNKMNLIIVHGAGSYGHVIVKKTGIDKGITNEKQLVDFSETQRLQTELSSIVARYFISHGLPVFPCQASACFITNKGRIEGANIDIIRNLVKSDVIPLLSGVPAYDKDKICSILSGDQIAPYLATELNAVKIIHVTNVGGVYDKDPNKFPEAKQIPEITENNFEEVKRCITGSLDTDVSGGMLTKVSELMNIGVESQIISGLILGNITRALKGENVGTIIRGG